MSRWQSEKGQEHDWVSGQQARCRDELTRLNEQYRAEHGDDYYLYTSRPGDGQTRVVFTDAVCKGYAAGLRHMQARIALALARETAWQERVAKRAAEGIEITS
jgi:hypothetical protein